jgi:hypothetical protein
MRSARAALPLLTLALLACAGSPPPATPKAKLDETVPANSAFEKPAARPAPAREDIPDEAPLSATAAPPPTAPAALATAQSTASPQPLVPPPTGPKVSKQECGKLFDRYIELAVGSNPELASVTKDMIAQAKAGAAAQKGDPCMGDPPTRSQYTCAMGAKTPAQWETCLK